MLKTPEEETDTKETDKCCRTCLGIGQSTGLVIRWTWDCLVLCQLLIDVNPLVPLWGLVRTIARLLDLSNKDLRTVACRLASMRTS